LKVTINTLLFILGINVSSKL